MASYVGKTSEQSKAAYQRKKKPAKRKLAYQPTSVIPGVQHVIEGRENLYEPTRRQVRGDRVGGSQIGKHPEMTYVSRVDQGEKRDLKQKTSQYAAEDLARSKLKPIADPEQEQIAERKRAARRRMRGRLGTLLSERGTLG